MKKKGEWGYLQAITILVGIIAAGILTSIVIRISSTGSIAETLYTKDTGLLLETAVGAPQDLRMIYNGEGYVVLIEGTVSYSTSESKGHYYHSLKGNDVNIVDRILWSEPYFIIKDNRTISLSTDPMTLQEAPR